MPINFDLQDTLDQMLDSTKLAAGTAAKEAKKVAANFLKNRKERLALLAELRLSGDLPGDKFTSRLNDEKLLLEAELNALAVFTKSSAQATAQNVLNIFQSAVLSALPASLKK